MEYRLELCRSRLSGGIKDNGSHVKIWIIVCEHVFVSERRNESTLVNMHV